MKTVHEIARLSGVSRRTLQYYDEIGLLTPCSLTEAGYRQYDEENLLRLWQILFYKELGLSLSDIKKALDGSKASVNSLLSRQKQVLLAKQAQLAQIMKSIDKILEGHFEIMMLRDFDNSPGETEETPYAEAAEQRRPSGGLFNELFHPLAHYKMQKEEKFRMSAIMDKYSDLRKTDWESICRQAEEVGEMFYRAMPEGPDSAAAEAAVAAFAKFVLPLMGCGSGELSEIGQAYLRDKTNVNQKLPGLAEFVNAAFVHYVRK